MEISRSSIQYYKTEYPDLTMMVRGFVARLTAAILRKVTLSFLRVCINLTNSSSFVCESLNTDLSLSTLLVRIIASDLQRYSESDYHDTASKDGSFSSHEDDQERKESRFELLLLSLGLMINFIQESETVKDQVLSTRLGTDIKDVFESLVAREVTLPYYSDLSVGTSEPRPGILGAIICPLDYSITQWEDGRYGESDQSVGGALTG
jgi:hypothetical protein